MTSIIFAVFSNSYDYEIHNKPFLLLLHRITPNNSCFCRGTKIGNFIFYILSICKPLVH